MNNNPSCILKHMALENGACIAGIADLTRFVEPAHGSLKAVVFGLRYCDRAVDALPAEDAWESMALDLTDSASQIYSRINNYLKTVSPDTRSCRIDKAQEELRVCLPTLSQKAIAVLAGLGWIGKSSLLINPTWGPRVRLGTLLTNAALDPDPPFQDNHCLDCQICADNCPGQAISHTGRELAEFTTFSIDTRRCICQDVNLAGRGKICGICLKLCPYGT